MQNQSADFKSEHLHYKYFLNIKCFFLLLVVCLSGCALGEIKKQTEVLEGAGIVQGKIVNKSSQKGPVNALVFELINGEVVYQGATYVTENDEFRFYVTPGVYQIIGHVDENHDGEYQPGEHVKYDEKSQYISVSEGETVDVSLLVISDEQKNDVSIDTSDQQAKQYANLGKVVTLADPVFARENYEIGLWRPLDFLHEVGGGLFLLQEYDPQKTPILFVHGINGGPLDWKTVIEALDTDLYQPWVFYYASGIQLDIISDTLLQSLSDLQKRLGYNSVKVIAHSMGGLVVRSFIKKYAEVFPKEHRLVDLVMTVNSPLGGMSSAAKGVKFSPIVVQSWKDVAVGSDFLARLYESSWPDNIPYHLVFSFLEGNDGDGVVSLGSQIPRSLQKEAVKMHGFPNSHVGTLSDSDFIAVLNQVIGSNVE